MKKLAVVCCFAVALMATGCHKTCRCMGYDGGEYDYTAEQVEELAGGNCSTMIIQADTRYYSVCNWE